MREPVEAAAPAGVIVVATPSRARADRTVDGGGGGSESRSTREPSGTVPASGTVPVVAAADGVVAARGVAAVRVRPVIGTTGEGVGSWITLNFDQASAVNAMRYANRDAHGVEWNEQLQLDFATATGTETRTVELIAPTSLNDDWNNVYTFERVSGATSLTLTVLSVYGAINNGAEEIELYDLCYPPPYPPPCPPYPPGAAPLPPPPSPPPSPPPPSPPPIDVFGEACVAPIKGTIVAYLNTTEEVAVTFDLTPFSTQARYRSIFHMGPDPTRGVASLWFSPMTTRLHWAFGNHNTGQAAIDAYPIDAASSLACDPASWTGYDNQVCGNCSALVNVLDNGGVCGSFCELQGLGCSQAWDDETGEESRHGAMDPGNGRGGGSGAKNGSSRGASEHGDGGWLEGGPAHKIDDGGGTGGGAGWGACGSEWIGEGGGWRVSASTVKGNRFADNLDGVRGGRRRRGARRKREWGWWRWLRRREPVRGHPGQTGGCILESLRLPAAEVSRTGMGVPLALCRLLVSTRGMCCVDQPQVALLSHIMAVIKRT